MATVAEALEPSGFAPGLRFGPFRLVRRLGAGGCAQVWLAVEEGPQGFRKQVALKVVDEQGEAARTMFQALVNEARVGGHLKHPNIVDLYRIGEVRGSWYIAMEYVDGSDLDVLLTRVRALGLALPTSIVAEIGLRMAQALDYAHNAVDDEGNPLRLVHRDLKPANVLISRGGRIKVADFGIAKATTNVKSTTVGHLKGTPCYMAPEVWRGSREFLPRMDLFSLGSMLWEMCSGVRLAQGTNLAAVAGRLMFGSAQDEADAVGGQHPHLVEILRGLLQRKARKRTQTAAEVVDAMRAVLREVARPGDLDLYLSLVERGALPEDERQIAPPVLHPPDDVDASWSAVFSLARGEAVEAVETLQFQPPPLPTDESLDSLESAALAPGGAEPALVSTEDVYLDDLPNIGAAQPDRADQPTPIGEGAESRDVAAQARRAHRSFGGFARVAAPRSEAPGPGQALVTAESAPGSPPAPSEPSGPLPAPSEPSGPLPAPSEPSGPLPAPSDSSEPPPELLGSSEPPPELLGSSEPPPDPLGWSEPPPGPPAGGIDRFCPSVDDDWHAAALSPSPAPRSVRPNWLVVGAAAGLLVAVAGLWQIGADDPAVDEAPVGLISSDDATAPNGALLSADLQIPAMDQDPAPGEDPPPAEVSSRPAEPSEAPTTAPDPAPRRAAAKPAADVPAVSLTAGAAPVAEDPETPSPRQSRPVEAPESAAVEAEPTGAPETGATAAGSQGCVVFQSTPTGAKILIDGRPADFYARSGSRSLRRFDEGPIEVTMGQGSREVSQIVQVRAGQRVAVSCSLQDPMACRVGRASGGCE